MQTFLLAGLTASTFTNASDIPTFAEMGLPALSFSNWSGLFAPRGTPNEALPVSADREGKLGTPVRRGVIVPLHRPVPP
jgi:hypothetical protein